MNLVLVYGPAAAGKLTIARELAEATGYKLVDNHFFYNIGEIFPYTDPDLEKVRTKLSKRFRVELLAAAASAGISIVTTMMLRNSHSLDYLRELIKAVEGQGGHVLIVQLHPSLDTIMERVENADRAAVLKLSTKDALQSYLERFPTQFARFPDVPHLTIDNSDLSPQQVVSQVIAHYHLENQTAK